MLKFVRNVFDSDRTSPSWAPGEDKALPPKSGGVVGTAAIFKNDFSSGPMLLVSKQGGRWSLPTEQIPSRQRTKDAIVAFMKSRFGLDCGELKFIQKKGLTRSQRQAGTVGGIEFVFGTVLSDTKHNPERKDCKWVPVSKIPRLSFGHATIARVAAEKLLGVVSEGTMIHQKLQNAYNTLDAWFTDARVEYDIVCDEDDLQGYMVPKKYEILTPRIMRVLESVSADNDLHCRAHETRSGLVIALSLQAIAEGTIKAMAPDLDVPRYQRRLDMVFNSAKPLAEAGSYNTGPRNSGLRRRAATLCGPENLKEDLKGIAAHFQPVEILKRVERAMVDLGLVDALKAAGITNRLSKDKQVLRFFITDAEGRGREIAAYDLVKLGEPNDFEKALKDLRDLAHNRSPGTSEREMNRIRDQEAAVKDTAKKYTPQPEAEETDKPTKPIVAGAPMGESRGDRFSNLIEQLLFQ